MRTLSGLKRSSIAVPSARNSGLERIWKLIPLLLCVSIFSIASAVLTGTVDFSTTILSDFDTSAIIRAALSQYVRSAAFPAPRPRVLVGVLTETKTISASHTCFSTSVLKKRFLPLHCFTTSSRPGS
ncbi:hypothetical protein HanIR_Chr15g0743131 [Helianthus annuus]|nr:hypothetical protein HanIR_Chr15g0743131 [Helianthus annuus]